MVICAKHPQCYEFTYVKTPPSHYMHHHIWLYSYAGYDIAININMKSEIIDHTPALLNSVMSGNRIRQYRFSDSAARERSARPR